MGKVTKPCRDRAEELRNIPLRLFFVYTFIYFSLFGSAPLCSGGRREDPGGGRRSSHARPGRVAAPGGGRLKSSSADGGSASLREDGAGSRPHFPGHSTRTTGEGFCEAVLLVSEFCGRVKLFVFIILFICLPNCDRLAAKFEGRLRRQAGASGAGEDAAASGRKALATNASLAPTYPHVSRGGGHGRYLTQQQHPSLGRRSELLIIGKTRQEVLLSTLGCQGQCHVRVRRGAVYSLATQSLRAYIIDTHISTRVRATRVAPLVNILGSRAPNDLLPPLLNGDCQHLRGPARPNLPYSCSHLRWRGRGQRGRVGEVGAPAGEEGHSKEAQRHPQAPF